MKRRSAGEGSVFQRKERRADGSVELRWVGVMEAGWGPGGKRVRRTVYGKTRKVVADKLKQLRRDRDAGLRMGERQTVAEHITHWLEDVVKVSKQPSTYRTYTTIARTHIAPTIGHILLTRLAEEDVQAMVNARRASGVAPGTVRYAKAVLVAALRQAVTWHLVPRNVAQGVALPTGDVRDAVVLGPLEVAQLMAAAAGDPWEALYAVAVFTGLRQGEILGLRWADVDWAKQVLKVRGQATVDGVHVRTKSRAGLRDVAFGPELGALLKTHHAEQLTVRSMAGSRWAEHDLVFANSFGRPRAASDVRQDFYALLEAAGLPRMHFHDLRHAYASLLDRAGVSQRTAQALLGHANASMTDRYQHAYDDQKAAAATAVERMVSGS